MLAKFKGDVASAPNEMSALIFLCFHIIFSHIDEYVENVVLQKTFKNSHTHYLTTDVGYCFFHSIPE